MEIQQNALAERKSSLCSLGPMPILMEGAVLLALRRAFSDSRRIQNPSLANYLWTANMTRESMFIEKLDVFDPASAGVRPAVLVRHQDWRPTPAVSIGDITHGAVAIRGGEHYVRILQGAISIFAVVRESGEAKILGAEVVRYFNAFGQKLREQFDLLKFEFVNMSPASPVKEMQDHFGVAIDLAYAHNDAHTIYEHAPRIDTIQIEDINLTEFR